MPSRQFFKRFPAFVLLIALSWSGAVAMDRPPAGDYPSLVTFLTLFHTNDTHGHLLPFSLKEFGEDIGGAARRAGYLRLARERDSEILVLDGGDIFQGTPFYSFFRGEADLKAFSAMGYDATTLGNHELDHGLDNLQAQLAKASFPLLCANVVDARTRERVFPPSTILTRKGLRIGLLGIIGKEAWEVTARRVLEGMAFLDPLTVTKAWVAVLRPKVDLLILLSHSGYESDVRLAERLSGIDIIVGGHTNTYLEDPIDVKTNPRVVRNGTDNGIGGTLVVQAFKWGVFVGRLDLGFDVVKKIRWYHGRMVKMDPSLETSDDPKVAAIVGGYYERIRSLTAQVLGSSPETLSYPEEQKHVRDLPLGSLVADGLCEFTGSDLAILNSGSIRTPIPAGPVTMDLVYQVLPFENTIYTYRMKGQDLRRMFGFIAANYGRISGFQYGGVSFAIDRAAGRATDILIGGRPLRDQEIYKLATISYLADGNQSGDSLFQGAVQKTDTGYLMREALIERLRRDPTLRAPQDRRLLVRP